MAPAALPSNASSPIPASSASQSPVRMFGRYQLLGLIGKSDMSMAWAALDTRLQQECVLLVQRLRLSESDCVDWNRQAQRASRLHHPCLARAIDSGTHDRWPYFAYESSQSSTWSDRLSSKGFMAVELAAWSAQIAQGLAFAHEAGVVHLDLQPWMLLCDEGQQASVMGLGLLSSERPEKLAGVIDELRETREAAERDVFALGLVMHHALTGQPALDEPDVGKLMKRLAPVGQEFVRLPWSVPRPVPDPLRAIVNRATERQPRQRYRNARTLQRALEGWLKTVASAGSGPLALLMDRFQSVGVLPSQPGGAERVALLAMMDRSRTSELAELALSDVALTFDLLRLVNSAQVHGVKVSEDAPVLMLRRAVAMLGLDGLRRAALNLRPWPGPLSIEAARDMALLIQNAHRAARIAVRLVSAGYDSEVIYLTALMQNLGWLLVQYHFPEETAQIRRLMQSAEASNHKAAGPAAPGDAKPSEKVDEPGMSAEAASFAVLGVDVEELGIGVAKHWGLDENVQLIMRRWPLTATVHPPASDMDVLRTTASCANEMVDALSLPTSRVQAALRVVFQRYGRLLSITLRDIQDELQLETYAASPTAQPRIPSPAKKAGAPATKATPKAGQDV